MKMWTSPELVMGVDGLEQRRSPRPCWWICSRWLRSHFDWPISAKFFWITLGLEPSANYVAVQFKNITTPEAPLYRGRALGRRHWEYMYGSFRNAIARHFGSRLTNGPLYLGVLYEE